MFPPLPREVNRKELMDEVDSHATGVIGFALRELERVNRVFGNHKLMTRHLEDLTRGIPEDREITLLDVGTGGGDLPAAAARWVATTRRKVHVIAMDRSMGILRFAGERLRGLDGKHLLIGDAASLPFPDHSVDIVLCSQVLHHLADRVAVSVIGEMNRVCRVGWIVSDLRRSRLAYRLTQAAIWLTSRSPLIRFDGPLSILRSFTTAEYRRLIQDAGADRAVIRNHRFFRTAVVYRRNDDRDFLGISKPR